MATTKDIIKSITAVVLAIMITASCAAILCSVSADAATVKNTTQVNQIPASTTKLNQFAKAYNFKASGKTSGGYDWTYKASANNLSVKCKYDFKTCKYNFKFTGKSYGLNNITLKYKTSDKKWASVKLTIFVDSQNYIMRTA